MAQEGYHERVYKGVAASPGIAQGQAFVFLEKELEVPLYHVAAEKSDYEIERFEQALIKTREQIGRVRSEVAQKLGEEEAQIFDAHLLVLEDRALVDETIRSHKESLYNIDYCFQAVVKRYIEAFDKIDDEYIKERATDIRDVAKRVLENLLGETRLNLVQISQQKIIVSADLHPSDTGSLKKGEVLGFVTDAGSRTSHAVIMARSLRIPAVVGLNTITSVVQTDDFLLIDGYEGLVFVNPTEETKRRYTQFQEERTKIQAIYDSCKSLPSQTLDGEAHSIMLNIDGSEETADLANLSSDGIGLFRTESLFMEKDRFPSEDAQYEYYNKIVTAISPKPVVIRTLDLGGDKKQGSLFYTNEQNPFLGFRAIRFCLEHKELFKDQLRAILRTTTNNNVRIMYPMISGVEELIEANTLLAEAKRELDDKNIPYGKDIKIGVMIEVPSIMMIIDHLKDHCSFISVGTNDLIQYILAVDRLNQKVASMYNPGHPAVLRALDHIIQNCRKHGLEVNVCGEMAGDILYAPLLLGMGVHNLSLNPGAYTEIKYLMRSVTSVELKTLVREVLENKSSVDTAKKLKKFYFEKLHSILEKKK